MALRFMVFMGHFSPPQTIEWTINTEEEDKG